MLTINYLFYTILLYLGYLEPHDVEDVPEGRINPLPSHPQYGGTTRAGNKTLPNALAGGLVAGIGQQNNKYQITDLKKTIEVKSRGEGGAPIHKDKEGQTHQRLLSSPSVGLVTRPTTKFTSVTAADTTTTTTTNASYGRSKVVDRRRGGDQSAGGSEVYPGGGGGGGQGEVRHPPQSTPDDARKTIIIARKGLMVVEEKLAAEEEDELSAGSGNKKDDEEEEEDDDK